MPRRLPLAPALLLVVALAPACGADPALAPADGGATTPPADGAVATRALRCSGKGTPPRDDTWKLVTADGRERTLHVHVPPTYDPTVRTPLVLNFHGFTSNAGQQDLLSHMTEKADLEGFIAVHPEGTGAPQSWNAGACCGEALQKNVDDVGFIGRALDELEARLCVDERRVFATGMSNGGFLSHRVACEMADRVAAVAPVAGVLGLEHCAPSRPVPVMHFHGTLDPLVPYDGSPVLGFHSVPDTFAAWAKRDGCAGEPVETFRHLDSHCATYRQCAGGADVTLCTVDGGGHTWPGGTVIPGGYTTPNLSATEAMWSFFSAHPMPM